MNTNPMLLEYHSLIASGKIVAKMEWQKDSGPRKPTGLIFIFDDDTKKILDISHLSEDEYRKYYSQLKAVWSFLFEN